MNDKLIYAGIGILIGAGLVWFFMNFSSTGTGGMMGIKSGPQNIMQSQAVDAHFIEQMIPHHEDAITMSELALTRASRPEVKELAQNIIDSQSKEITQMKSWYKEWFGKEVPQNENVMGGHGMTGGGSMHMGMMGDETDIESLENAEDFDQAFLSEMIPHHQMAVMMANMLKNGTDRPEMKKLAEDIISAQTSEIDQMREWLKDWGN